jgi:hypothetical protein
VLVWGGGLCLDWGPGGEPDGFIDTFCLHLRSRDFGVWSIYLRRLVVHSRVASAGFGSGLDFRLLMALNDIFQDIAALCDLCDVEIPRHFKNEV